MEYQVLARKYRPRFFHEVVGQEAIVTTLKNAIRFNRLAHAYLFCGSRGTGKTTLARLFAKALNCQQPTSELEPCNQCSSCREIASGSSMDVLEIDGASHRGIDDIRQINETVAYASSSGKYKVYIIDEVHMLTKEAFNALLKTLEEPPAKVKFFFATTEPHKVPPTILSRCQRFNLNRIPIQAIIHKLQTIAQDLKIDIQEEAIRLIADRADGGLRDAESLLDQIIAFQEGTITAEVVASVLGIMPKEILFELDRAGKEGEFAIAFEIAYKIFSQGKDIAHFVETLTEHFRNILLIKLSGKEASFLTLAEHEKTKYEMSAKLYSKEQCLLILEFLMEAQNQIRFAPSPRIALEALLLRILRTHHRLPVDFLVRRLSELEQTLNKDSQSSASSSDSVSKPPIKPDLKPDVKPVSQYDLKPDPKPESKHDLKSDTKPEPKHDLEPDVKPPPKPAVQPSVTLDPTPSPADLGLTKKEPSKTESKPQKEANLVISSTQQSHYDTLIQFAAVELEGSVKKSTNYSRT